MVAPGFQLTRFTYLNGAYSALGFPTDMAMSGYFTDGKPSPGVPAPLSHLKYDPEDVLTKEPSTPTPPKNYETIKSSKGGEYMA